jgi:GH3 auxin-responsive promoter
LTPTNLQQVALIEIQLPSSVTKALRLPQKSPAGQQTRVLKKLLKKARFTEFGQEYEFDKILFSRNPEKKFREFVPVFDYNKIYSSWWHKTLNGKPDVCWPGKIKYYALSSGTSESSSKYIPITNDLLRGNRMVMIKQLLSLRTYHDIPVKSISKGWLMIGGSTDLQRGSGYYAGDLSGISAKKVPFWFAPFYKPGKKIARTKDWNKKIEEVVKQAPNWDIGFLVGVPAWIQLCLEKIIERYGLKNIHELWPNLGFYVHGGVSFEPYKKGFEKLLAKPLTYIETYLASEGFIAYQDRQHTKSMRLVTSEHIFLEFVLFDENNFDKDGNIVGNPDVFLVNEVNENVDYAILISTSGGAWRYLIGDTIKFTDKKRCEIVITGRVKHYLNLAGEHLSVDNMNKAVQLASDELNISIPEFTVAGISQGLFFSHQWYIASDDLVEAGKLRALIDEKLKKLNDDYAVERSSALKEIYLKVLPEAIFSKFMHVKGKVGGQHKFPRVLKGKILQEWQEFLRLENY